MDRRISDREVYPAAWIVAVLLPVAFLFWKYLLGAPTISGCWFYQNWHLYCPGCGGTRALEALIRGQLLRALYYHPAVPVTAVWGGIYLLAQTLWRLRGKQGWVLCYHPSWTSILACLLLLNCLVRNALWFGFGIAI